MSLVDLMNKKTRFIELRNRVYSQTHYGIKTNTKRPNLIYKERFKMIKRMYIIKTEEDKEYEVLEKIHNQLVGNPDYINNNIVLNDSGTRNDGTINEVHVCIFEECRNIPEIRI